MIETNSEVISSCLIVTDYNQLGLKREFRVFIVASHHFRHENVVRYEMINVEELTI